jgi:hypothetical protein
MKSLRDLLGMNRRSVEPADPDALTQAERLALTKALIAASANPPPVGTSQIRKTGYEKRRRLR